MWSTLPFISLQRAISIALQDPAQLKIKLEVENLKKKLLAKERELKEEKGKVSKGRADIDRLQEESARLEEGKSHCISRFEP